MEDFFVNLIQLFNVCLYSIDKLFHLFLLYIWLSANDKGPLSSREVDQTHREKDSNNEMVKLFYGKVKTYGTNAGIVKFSSLSCL